MKFENKTAARHGRWRKSGVDASTHHMAVTRWASLGKSLKLSELLSFLRFRTVTGLHINMRKSFENLGYVYSEEYPLIPQERLIGTRTIVFQRNYVNVL